MISEELWDSEESRNLALQNMNKLHFKIHEKLKMVILNWNNMLQYYCFIVLLGRNAALVSNKRLLGNTLEYFSIINE